jgi:ABC-type transport system substrate-binding protein
MLNEFASGRVDVVPILEWEDLAQLNRGSLSDSYVVSSMSSQSLFLEMNTTNPPLDNEMVRRAVRLSINSERFVRTALGGYGSASTQALISPLYSWSAQLPTMGFDPQKCRSTLESAGFGDGIKLSVAAPKSWESALSTIIEDARTCGITMEVSVRESNTYWSLFEPNQANQRNRYHMLCNSMPSSIRPFNLIRQFTQGAFVWSAFGYKDDGIASALQGVGRSTNEQEEIQRAAEVVQLVQDRGPIAHIAWLNNVAVVRNKVRGLQLAPDGRFDAHLVSIEA